MRKQMIQNAAHEVATQIRQVEESIEQALIDLSELQGKMIQARASAGVATALGHKALEQVAESLQGLVAARGGVAMAHAILKETMQHVPGLRTVSYGDGEPTPPPTTGYATLQIVA